MSKDTSGIQFPDGNTEIMMTGEPVIDRMIENECENLPEYLSSIIPRALFAIAGSQGEGFTLEGVVSADFRALIYDDKDGNGYIMPVEIGILERVRKSAVHRNLCQIVDALVKPGIHPGSNDEDTARYVHTESLNWVREHLTGIYPTSSIKWGRRDRTERELTLHMMLASVIISGKNVSNRLSDMEVFDVVPALEREKVGLYLALRLKKKHLRSYVPQILGAFYSFGLINVGESSGGTSMKTERDIIEFSTVEGAVREQSQLWESFKHISTEVLSALGRNVGRSDMSFLELVCRYHGWPYDRSILDHIRVHSKELDVNVLGAMLNELPSEPQRESLTQIGKKTGAHHSALSVHLSKAVVAIQDNDPISLFSQSQPNRPRISPRPVERIPSELTVGDMRAQFKAAYDLTRDIVDEREHPPHEKFNGRLRLRLLERINEVLDPELDSAYYKHYDTLHALAEAEFSWIKEEMKCLTQDELTRAAVKRFPALAHGLSTLTMQDIVDELVLNADTTTLKSGYQWRSRVLSLEVLEHWDITMRELMTFAEMVISNGSDRESRFSQETEKAPDRLKILGQRESYLTQFFAVAAISAGITDTGLRKRLERATGEVIPRKPLKADRGPVLMKRLEKAYRVNNKLLESTPPGRRSTLTTELCRYLPSCSSIPLALLTIVSTVQGYSLQFVSETIDPEQLRIAHEIAKENYRASPEDGYKFKPYSTILNYLLAGRRAIFLAYLRAVGSNTC